MNAPVSVRQSNVLYSYLNVSVLKMMRTAAIHTQAPHFTLDSARFFFSLSVKTCKKCTCIKLCNEFSCQQTAQNFLSDFILFTIEK